MFHKHIYIYIYIHTTTHKHTVLSIFYIYKQLLIKKSAKRPRSSSAVETKLHSNITTK